MKTILALSLVLVAQMASAKQGVYGTWKFPQIVSGPFTMNSTLNVAQGQVTIRSVCQISGQQTVAEASAPANITESEIQVLGTAHKEVNENGLNCNASIDASNISYMVSEDDASLTLSAPGQDSLTISRQ